MSIFHFQHRGQADWEPIGAGVGEGDMPVMEALADLRELAGGSLPAGSYRVIEARSSDPRWESFELDLDCRLIEEAVAEDPLGRAIERSRRACLRARAERAIAHRLCEEAPRLRAERPRLREPAGNP
jgi:hypothetical protein